MRYAYRKRVASKQVLTELPQVTLGPRLESCQNGFEIRGRHSNIEEAKNFFALPAKITLDLQSTQNNEPDTKFGIGSHFGYTLEVQQDLKSIKRRGLASARGPRSSRCFRPRGSRRHGRRRRLRLDARDGVARAELNSSYGISIKRYTPDHIGFQNSDNLIQSSGN